MIHVLINGKRMEYLKDELDAKIIDNNSIFEENDVIVLPIHWENLCDTLDINIYDVNNMILFVPFKTNLFNESNTVYAYMEDANLIKENAKLTALGIVQLLNEFNLSLYNLEIDIIGYGNCAKALGYIFDFLNVKYRYIYYKPLKNGILSDAYHKKGNVIINTAPICILDMQDPYLKDVKMIIDIDTNKCMNKLHEKVNIQYPGSLPDKYYSKSAAGLLGYYIRRMLNAK